MNGFTREDAMLLAATEVLPAEWRDLNELLEPDASFTDLVSGDDEACTSALLGYLRANLDYARVDHWEKVLFRLGLQGERMRMLRVSHPAYPANLRQVRERPPFLFIDGTLLAADSRAIAIVGGRKASHAGLDAAQEVAHAMAAHSITVVSGLALGIDAAAHEGALSHDQGRTIAVLGSGIDVISPRENLELAERIRSRGCLVSQFRPGSPPTKSSFPMRNAIISGLARASLLIESAEQSGTRIEAEHALRQGRPVFLWEPTMKSIAWARGFARQPGVSFASTITELLDAVDGPASASMT